MDLSAIIVAEIRETVRKRILDNYDYLKSEQPLILRDEWGRTEHHHTLNGLDVEIHDRMLTIGLFTDEEVIEISNFVKKCWKEHFETEE